MISRLLYGSLLALAASVSAVHQDVEKRAPSGFVTRSGTGFVMDGETYSFGGTNAYWATSLVSEDISSLFSQMNSGGLKVLRIFGWGDNVGGPEDGSFQYWSGSTNTPNEAAFAAHMDPLVAAAESAGVKLVIPMIGNWGPSINLYIQQVLGSSATHDTFYSDSGLVAAYKTYIKFFVNRYSSSPAIFAWELMNEPRCSGDDNRGQSSACGDSMITNWITEISAYIKSIDSNHMVTVGDEGWFSCSTGYSDCSLTGDNGIDWVTNLKVDSIDYGTIHLYPDIWGQADSWGSTWIEEHETQARNVGKPVVLEEFGTSDTSDRQSIVSGWLTSAKSSGFGGFQFWQFVTTFPSGYTSPNDGNGISTGEDTYSSIKSFASEFDESGGGSPAPSSSSSSSLASSSSGSASRASSSASGVSSSASYASSSASYASSSASYASSSASYDSSSTSYASSSASYASSLTSMVSPNRSTGSSGVATISSRSTTVSTISRSKITYSAAPAPTHTSSSDACGAPSSSSAHHSSRHHSHKHHSHKHHSHKHHSSAHHSSAHQSSAHYSSAHFPSAHSTASPSSSMHSSSSAAAAHSSSAAGTPAPDSQGYVLPISGTGSTTQFVLGTELSNGTACGMSALPSGYTGSGGGSGPGYLYAAINQLAFGANPAAGAGGPGAACGICYALTPVSASGEALTSQTYTFMIIDECPVTSPNSANCGQCSTSDVNSFGKAFHFDIASDAMDQQQYDNFFKGVTDGSNWDTVNFKQTDCEEPRPPVKSWGCIEDCKNSGTASVCASI